MKTTSIFVIAMILLTIPFAGNRYRYIDKSVPLYLCVKSLPDDTDDAVSTGIKGALINVGIKLVSKSEYISLQKAYQDDVKENISRVSFADAWKSSAERFHDTFGRGEQSQKVTIFYVFKEGVNASFDNLDSIGFTCFKLPPRSASDHSTRVSFSISRVGSTNTDSLVSFLLTQL